MEGLVKIQNELKVPKGNINKFGNYKYRSAEDILEAVKPILRAYAATLTMSDDIILVGSKIFLKATATIEIGSVSKSVNGFAETSEHKGMSSEQTTGTASSYARKYALNGLFLIDETESDIDSKDNRNTLPELKQGSDQFNKAIEWLKGDGTIDKIKSKYLLTKTVEDLLKNGSL